MPYNLTHILFYPAADSEATFSLFTLYTEKVSLCLSI